MSDIEIKKNRKYTLTKRNRFGGVQSKQRVKVNSIVKRGRGFTVMYSDDASGRTDTLPMQAFQRLAAKK